MIYRALGVCLGLLASQPLQAEFDRVELQLHQDYAPVQRWEQVTASRYWLAGKRLGDPAGARWAIRLEPGEQALVHLPADEVLRLRATGPDKNSSWPPRVQLGAGSGLFRPVQVLKAQHEGDLLVPNDKSQAMHVRLSQPPAGSAAVTFTAWVSRHEPLGNIAPYRQLIPLSAAGVHIRAQAASSGQRYDRLRAGEAAAITLQGPRAVQVQHRLHYGETTSDPQQSYRLHYRLDAQPWRIQTVETAAVTATLLRLDGEPQVLGRSRETFIWVPAGSHRLTLVSERASYVRLLARARSDYLVPALNAPRRNPQTLAEQYLSGQPPASLWEGSAAALTTLGPAAAAGQPPSSQRLLRLARDNHYQGGGLVAAGLLAAARQNYPHVPEIDRAAAALRGQHSFFRDLLPDRLNRTSGSLQARFAVRELVGRAHAPQHLVLARQHRQAYAARLGNAYFTPVGGSAQPNSYVIPSRFAPSELRLLVAAPGLRPAQTLWVQFADNTPLALTLHPELAAAPEQWQPHAGLALRQAEARQANRPLGLYDDEPVMQVASATLPLSPATERFQVWCEPACEGLRLGVQYRAPRPTRLSESAYLALSAGHGPSELQAWFLKELAGQKTQTESPKPGPQALSNHWQPTLRLLRARQRLFRANVSAFASPPLALSASQLASRRTAAREAVAAAQWPAAFAAWWQVYRASEGVARRRAALAGLAALAKADEDYLYQQLLRGLTLHAADPLLRHAARQRLHAHYQRTANRLGLQGLLTHAWTTSGDPGPLICLLKTLATEGEIQAALDLALLLPAASRPVGTLKQLTFRARWWRHFEQAQAAYPEAAGRADWQARRLAATGQFEALAGLLATQTLSATLQTRLSTALAIRRQLHSPLAASRQQAVTAWVRWQSEQPGPFLWQPQADLVAGHAGAIWLESLSRAQGGYWFRAVPGQPVTLQVEGPGQVRVQARLLHPAGDVTPIDTWLSFEQAGAIRHEPIQQSRPTAGLEPVGLQAQIPGREQHYDLAVPAGTHQIVIRPARQPVLLRAARLTPVTPLALLPRLTPANHARLKALAATRKSNTRKSDSRQNEPQRTDPFPAPRQECRWQGCLFLVDAELKQSAHVSLAKLRRQAPLPAGLPWLQHAENTMLNRFTAAGASEVAPNTQSPARQAVELLWQMEQQPGRRLARFAQLATLRARFPDNARIAAVMNRARRSLRWERLRSVTASAGIRRIELAQWQPESPGLRVRQALAGVSGDRLLLGRDTLVLTLAHERATTLSLDLALFDLPYLPAEPLTLLYRLDTAALQRVQLTRTRTSTQLELAIPAGEHQVRLWLADPVTNQALAVRLRQPRPSEHIDINLERHYHVATQAEPVQVSLLGPQVVRIDERRPHGQTWTTTRVLPPGRQTLVLTPRGQARAALYRLSRRVPADTPPLHARFAATPPATVPPVPVTLATIPTPTPGLDDPDDDLRQQDDATLLLDLARVRDRPLEEETAATGTFDRYWQVRGGYRYFREPWDTYFSTDLMFRHHDAGEPSLGLAGRLDYTPTHLPWSVRLGWAGYTQAAQGRAWSSTLRGTFRLHQVLGPQTYHGPALGVFQRHLGQQAGFDYRREAVDRDVLTLFKDLHRRGLVLADTWVHRPWLDTQWRLRAALTSDEQWRLHAPEHLTLQASWQQLLGAWQVDAGYRWTRFFAEDDRFWRRPNAIDQREVNAELMLDHRVHGWGRLRTAVDLRYDLGSNQYGLVVSLGWVFDHGRGNRDFRPGAIDFTALRRRQSSLK